MIDRAMERGAESPARKRHAASTACSGGAAACRAVRDAALPDIEEWPEHEMLASEFATVGFYISGHPLSKYAARLKELNAVELASVEGRRNGEEITVAGIVIAMRSMRSRKGDRWGILTLAGHDRRAGSARVSGILRAARTRSQEQRAAAAEGRVNVEEAGARAWPCRKRAARQEWRLAPRVMRVRVDIAAMDEYTLDQLKELFVRSPGSCPVAFDLLRPGGYRWPPCVPISA